MRKCDKCKKSFNSCKEKENNVFLYYCQIEGANTVKPVKIYKQRPITYYSINFPQHSDFYKLFDNEKTVDNFIEAVRNEFVVTDNDEVEGSVCLVKYQPAESDVIIKLEGKRILLAGVYRFFLINL